jgi:hypothetical protein
MRVLFRSIFSLLLIFCGTALAQVGTQGAVVGSVKDVLGAIVPQTSVSLINLETNLSLITTADEEGAFNFLAVQPGDYRMEVGSPTFRTWVLEKITVRVGDRLRFEPVLEPGASVEKVEVSADSLLLQTENTAVQTVIQLEQIRELPLDNRDPIGLLALTPGTLYEGQDAKRVSYVRNQGMRRYKAAFQLDGILSNDGSDGGATTIPNSKQRRK